MSEYYDGNVMADVKAVGRFVEITLENDEETLVTLLFSPELSYRLAQRITMAAMDAEEHCD